MPAQLTSMSSGPIRASTCSTSVATPGGLAEVVAERVDLQAGHLLAIDDRDAGVLGQEARDDRAADAVRAAGDESGPPRRRLMRSMVGVRAEAESHDCLRP